jgi:hypothetical protein
MKPKSAQVAPPSSTRLGLVLTGADHDAFTSLAGEVPWLNHHALAALALRVGVEELAARPESITQLLTGRRTRYSGARR